MDIYKRLLELNIQLPPLPKPSGIFVPAKICGDLIYASGQTGKENGVLKYKGKIDTDLTIEEGIESARLAALNCIAELEFVVKDLNRIEEIIKVNGYVNGSPGFIQQPLVINGASQVLVDIFGMKGMHARAAIGVAELPGGAPVEIELIAKISRE